MWKSLNVGKTVVDRIRIRASCIMSFRINICHLGGDAFGMSCIISLPILEDLTEGFWIPGKKMACC